ncbi:lipopolysaccharide biosynthesis protein [Sphingobacterium sp. 2149]|uniref:lipopolysaccharide biosynthesis protein n=1 Tax=Sphingobacterium sp. 2149 TaxID=2817763 RepID=UPI0028573EEE|nr:lipopolysaccharide biosynthesis protein [Sphingobacterium sp. 2149]MDR6733830.1 O-antigen/teichoic acid export membrane protein [Sphingobacterium sp. 2149]
MKDLLKNFFSFGLATTIEKLLLFLFIPIYSKYLLQAELGVVDLLQVLAEGGTILALLQIESSFQRYYLDFKGRLKNIFISSTFIFVGISSILITILLMVFSKELCFLLFKDYKYVEAFNWSVAKIPLSNFSVLIFVMLRFENKTKLFFFYVLFRALSLLICTYAFLNFMEDSVIAISSSQFASVVLTFIGALFFLKNYLAKGFSLRIIKRSLNFSLPMVPARIGSFTVTYANRFFLVSLLSLSAIGIYSLSLKFASSVQIVYTAFIMAWPPFLFSTVKKENSKDIFKSILPLIACPVFLIVCGISIFSAELVKYFSTPTYSESSKYIGGLSLFFCLLIFKEAVDIGPKIKNKTQYITYSFFVSVIINVISLLVFTRYLGIQGVVLSMILTNTVLLIMSWVISNRLFYISFNVFQFILYAFPAYFISIFFMFYSVGLTVRFLILVIISAFYIYNFLENIKQSKNLIKV